MGVVCTARSRGKNREEEHFFSTHAYTHFDCRLIFSSDPSDDDDDQKGRHHD